MLSASCSEGNSPATNSGIYSWVCYSRNYITSKRCHLKDEAKFIGMRNRIYKSRVGSEGDHLRKIYPPASSRLPSSQRSSDLPEILIMKRYERSIRYPPRQGPGSNRWISKSSTNVLVNVAYWFRPRYAAAVVSQNTDRGEHWSGNLCIQCPPHGSNCLDIRQMKRTVNCKAVNRTKITYRLVPRARKRIKKTKSRKEGKLNEHFKILTDNNPRWI